MRHPRRENAPPRRVFAPCIISIFLQTLPRVAPPAFSTELSFPPYHAKLLIYRRDSMSARPSDKIACSVRSWRQATVIPPKSEKASDGTGLSREGATPSRSRAIEGRPALAPRAPSRLSGRPRRLQRYQACRTKKITWVYRCRLGGVGGRRSGDRRENGRGDLGDQRENGRGRLGDASWWGWGVLLPLD